MTDPTPDGITIRPLGSHAEFSACVALQRATWGAGFQEVVPPAILLVAQKMGGIVAGAFDGDRMIGFVFGVSGVRDGCTAHWSHMLAVLPEFRDRGIGTRLKRYQRDRLTALGIDRMYWTFDPLVARNAHLNLNHLGVRVVEYVREMYGDDPLSSMDAVIGTDRFVVEWDLRPGARDPEPAEHPDLPTLAPDPGGIAPALPDIPAVGVGVPADIHALKDSDPEGARAWRAVTRGAFEHYLAAGYAVRGFHGDPAADRFAYVLERASP